jgi:hypothetical protein
MSSFMTKSEVLTTLTGVRAISKRAVPTLGSILKYARLSTLMRPAAEEAESAQVIASAGADRYPDPETGQMRFVDQGKLNEVLLGIGKTFADFDDPGIRITEADLPKLPDFSDDATKNEKAVAARTELANEIAMLGKLFDYGTEPSK